MPFFILFLGMLSLMLMRVYLPLGGAQVRGTPLKTISLSFMERVLLQRMNVYAIAAVLILTAATGMVSSSMELPIILIALGMLFFPVRCTFTTEGVAVNNVVFRPWSELSGFKLERRRIVIGGAPGTRPLTLSLMGSHQQEVLPILRKRLQQTADKESASSRSLVQQAR